MEVHKIILLLIANAVVSNALAFLFTRFTNFKLKPFSCYGCLSFWLSLANGTALAFYVSPGYTCIEARQLALYGIIFTSAVIGLSNYYYIKSKFKVYE